jgi:hypothetical protein
VSLLRAVGGDEAWGGGAFTMPPPPPADPLVAAMHRELQAELRNALEGRLWSTALASAAHLLFRRLQGHVLDALPDMAVLPGQESSTSRTGTGSGPAATAREPVKSSQAVVPTSAMPETGRAGSAALGAVTGHEGVTALDDAAAVASGGKDVEAGHGSAARTWAGFARDVWAGLSRRPRPADGGKPAGGIRMPASTSTVVQEQCVDVSVQGGEATAGQAHVQQHAGLRKPARPTARLLRPVQLATEPLVAQMELASQARGALPDFPGLGLVCSQACPHAVRRCDEL